MNNTLTNDCLLELEAKAEVLLCDKMEPFRSGGIVCPWMRWRENLPEQPTGILLLQDWGTQEEKIDDAVSYLRDEQFSWKKDRTLYRLFNNAAWRDAIWGDDKKWLVTNAVWGLRGPSNGQPPEMCGYLGARIHKSAFPIWANIIAHFGSKCELKVVFAGSWAISDKSQRRVHDLKAFLEYWKEWATSGRFAVKSEEVPSLEGIMGQAHEYLHPSVWRAGSCGPP